MSISVAQSPLIEVVKTSNISRRWPGSYIAWRRKRLVHSRRTNSIYFFDIGVESSWRDGWTDKWMYVARMGLSSILRCVKDSRSLSFSLSTRIHEYIGWRSRGIFFLSPSCLFPLSFIPSFPHSLSPLLTRAPRAVTPSTRKPLRAVWKYTFIFEESYRWTERHVSTRTKPNSWAC